MFFLFMPVVHTEKAQDLGNTDEINDKVMLTESKYAFAIG